MQEESNIPQINHSNGEIDIQEIFSILIQGKKIISLITLFFLVIGIIYSLISCSMLILIYLNMILFALLISVISFQSFYYFEKSTYDFKYKQPQIRTH